MSDKFKLPGNLIVVAAILFIIGAYFLESMVSGVFGRLETMFIESEQAGFLSIGGMFLDVLIYGGIFFLIFRAGYHFLQLKPKGLKQTKDLLKVILVLASILIPAVIFIILFQGLDFVEIRYDSQTDLILSVSEYIFYCLALIGASAWSLRSLKNETVQYLFDGTASKK